MNYKNTLLELIRAKKEISEDNTVSMSLEEIANAWHRNVLYEDDDFFVASFKFKYIDHNFLEDVASAIKTLAKEGFIIFDYLLPESFFSLIANDTLKKDGFDANSISSITQLYSLRDRIFLKVKDDGKSDRGILKIEKEQVITEPTKHLKPYTEIENGIGYFKFYKEGKRIKISGKETRYFRFLQCLCNPCFGIEKTMEEVFEAIKIQRDAKDSVLTGFDFLQKMTRIRTIIKNSCIKELQKIKELQRISYKFGDNDKKIRLELED